MDSITCCWNLDKIHSLISRQKKHPLTITKIERKRFWNSYNAEITKKNMAEIADRHFKHKQATLNPRHYLTVENLIIRRPKKWNRRHKNPPRSHYKITRSSQLLSRVQTAILLSQSNIYSSQVFQLPNLSEMRSDYRGKKTERLSFVSSRQPTYSNHFNCYRIRAFAGLGDIILVFVSSFMYKLF